MAGISPVTTRDSVRWWFRRGRGKEAGGKGAPGSWGRFGTAKYGSLNIYSVQRCSFWSCSVWFQVCRICAEPGGECDFVLKYGQCWLSQKLSLLCVGGRCLWEDEHICLSCIRVVCQYLSSVGMWVQRCETFCWSCPRWWCQASSLWWGSREGWCPPQPPRDQVNHCALRTFVCLNFSPHSSASLIYVY